MYDIDRIISRTVAYTIVARRLGVPAPTASPALREEYARRAGLAVAYREAAGITNPDQAVFLQPHCGNPRAREHA